MLEADSRGSEARSVEAVAEVDSENSDRESDDSALRPFICESTPLSCRSSTNVVPPFRECLRSIQAASLLDEPCVNSKRMRERCCSCHLFRDIVLYLSRKFMWSW